MPPESKVRIPLNHDFRYFHEPVSGNLSEKWAVGRKQLAKEFADRIVLSRGGAFLVGGLRGVGKTTFVRLAMHEIQSGNKQYEGNVGHFELVDVWLNISRTLEPGQLLHLLIRHLYLRLKEVGLLNRLGPELQKDLNTAFLRTAFEISSRSLDGEERGRASEFGFGKAPWIGIEFLGKISSSYKRTQSDEEALKYLPYDEKAAEFDILNFARRLQEGIQPKVSFLQRLLHPFRPMLSAVPSIRVVFVLDELDKLENSATPIGTSPLDPILQSLKTVFSASGFSFVFVGGKEVEERMIEDASHADSIYESIFAYNLYLPCLWEDQGDILGRCLAPDDRKDAASYQQTVKRYLRYKGRGIPRRTWREVNKYVWWEEDGPKLILDVKSRRYMDLFSKLEEGLQDDQLFNALGRTADNVRHDREKLYFYYTADWVLGRGQGTFTPDDVVAMTQTLNLGGKLTPTAASAIAQTTLDILKNRACIEVDGGRTLVGDAPWKDVHYKLCPWVLRAFEGSAEEEAKAAVAASAAAPAQQASELRWIGIYQVIEEIGSGATSQIFKVRGPSSEIGAAKILRTDMAQNPMMVSRFSDEIAMLREFSDPGIVRVLGSGEHDGRPFLVMELLEGVALNTLISGVKALPVGTACRVAAELAGTLSRIHDRGWIHRDVKPGNIFVTHAGDTKLMDFGIGRRIMREDGTQPTMVYVLGTPGYMAPEQILNPAQVGVRSDVYSLAATLFEMITGQLPFGNPAQLKDWQGLVEEAPSLLQFAAVQKELAEAVGRALSRSPEVRLQTMEAFGSELRQWADASAEGLRGVVAQCQNIAFSSSTATLVGATLTKPILEMAAAPPSPMAAPFPGKAASTEETETVTRPIGQVGAGLPVPPTAVIEEERNEDEGLLWTGSQTEQEEAFRRLCEVSVTPHILFDFARRVCLWGGPGAISRTIILREEHLIIGRNASQVALPLEHRSISRQHLGFSVRLKQGDEAVLAEDLSSASGSQINGERLSRRPLSDGDILRVGEIDIQVHVLPGSALVSPLVEGLRTAFEMLALCYDFALLSTTDSALKKLLVDSHGGVDKVLSLDMEARTKLNEASAKAAAKQVRVAIENLIELRTKLEQSAGGAKIYTAILKAIRRVLTLAPRIV